MTKVIDVSESEHLKLKSSFFLIIYSKQAYESDVVGQRCKKLTMFSTRLSICIGFHSVPFQKKEIVTKHL